jgi:signal transduction histidine kinase
MISGVSHEDFLTGRCEDHHVKFRRPKGEVPTGWTPSHPLAPSTTSGFPTQNVNAFSASSAPVVSPPTIDVPLVRPTEILRRERNGAMIGGVAQGLASWLSIDVILIRAAFVIGASSAGVGLMVYFALWLRLELEAGEPKTKARMDTVSALSLGAITLGMTLIARRIGLALPARVLWPMLLGAAGVALVWPRVSDLAVPDRERLLEEGPRALGRTAAQFAGSSRSTVPRVIIGSVLVISGVSAFAVGDPSATAIRSTIVALVIMALGSACILGPWLVRLTTDLSEERVGLAKAQAREEFAAHLHDSVLQTLAIIQRRADDPRQVVALARRQERELRAWLFDGTQTLGEVDRLSVALELTAQEVESDHAVTIDVVSVGDVASSERVMTMVAAAREAMVNAAKHSNRTHIDIFSECGPDSIEVFIRDRGLGFDVATVPSDRRGISQSISARMERVGGRSTIRSTIGEGTEVELVLPRDTVDEESTE